MKSKKKKKKKKKKKIKKKKKKKKNPQKIEKKKKKKKKSSYRIREIKLYDKNCNNFNNCKWTSFFIYLFIYLFRIWELQLQFFIH